jgi:hypothetical protein
MARLAPHPAAATWGIPPQVRGVLRRAVLELRHLLEEDLRRQLAALGIREQGVDSRPRELSPEASRAREVVAAAIETRRRAGAGLREALDAYVREAAFTFLDRAVALRCLEERGLLTVDGAAESLIAPVADLKASSLYWRVRSELGSEAPARELWREAFRRACAAASERVRVLFDPDAEAAALFPLQPTILRLVEALGPGEIPPETWQSDEVLGWVYQYWNTEGKDEAYAKLKAKGKLARPEELAAATCLYTERYMVDFLVQNTLGALWHEMRPESSLPKRWPYFVPPPAVAPVPTRAPKRVRDITLLDPACGSGHFLLRAFDLFMEMYAEEGLEDPAEVPALILERNLYGTDIDARAVQIAALALYLKGCSVAGPGFRPRRLNLVSADVRLPEDGERQALLERFREDREARSALEGIWTELRDAPLLGSLLHPERALKEALAYRRTKVQTSLLEPGSDDLEAYVRELLEGLREHVEAETAQDDLGRKLFGEEVAKGVSLVELLSGRYDVVVTNPPYAGSKNLDQPVKGFVEREYADGKRDLYAAFILRCLDFARPGGYVGMVTQQSWLFLRSFAKLRRRVLEGTAVTTLAHLGPRAFEEIGGEVVNVALFTLRTGAPAPEHWMTAFRLVGPKSPAEKHRLLLGAIEGTAPGVVSTPKQADLLAIPETPFVYWFAESMLRHLGAGRKLRSELVGGSGLGTRDDERFTRCFWEVPKVDGKWFPYAKGGGFRRWAGLDWLVVNWVDEGREIREYLIRRFPYLRGNVGILIRQTERYFTPGVTYSDVARGALACRLLPRLAIFSDKGPGLFSRESGDLHWYLAYLNGRWHSFVLRGVSPTIEFPLGYVLNLPAPPSDAAVRQTFAMIGRAAVGLKARVIAYEPTERTFEPSQAIAVIGPAVVETVTDNGLRLYQIAAVLHSLEGWNDQLVRDVYGLGEQDLGRALDEIGVPAGWYPLIAGYDRLPDPPEGIELPEGFAEYFAGLKRRELLPGELSALKARLRKLYEAGPGGKVDEDEEAVASDDEEDEAVLGAHIPIPAETFLEELSQKLEVHPVSVYWLLEELRSEGILSPPEVKRAMEQWVEVATLLMLGYRWPEQDQQEAEHGPAIDPDLVDEDGVIPLVACGNHATAAERIRELWGRLFGEEGASRSESEFRRWVGMTLDDWFRRRFFEEHTRRFKQRPIAWHLSSPDGHFQALVLYHRLSRELLQRLRAAYAGALISELKAEREKAKGDQAKVSDLTAAIEDVEEFRRTLEGIERGDEPPLRIRCRWKGEEPDGRPGPYAPDLDDGVKVNIRPFQEAGLLAKPVIKKW